MMDFTENVILMDTLHVCKRLEQNHCYRLKCKERTQQTQISHLYRIKIITPENIPQIIGLRSKSVTQNPSVNNSIHDYTLRL